MGRLNGKSAFVTGGASGIGEATARAFATEGSRVAIADVDAPRGESVAAAIGGIFVKLDVTSEADWRAAIDHAKAAIGPLSVLVNNAGISIPAPIDAETFEGWRRTMAVNADGVFLGCKHGVEALREAGGGSIVNVSSTLGIKGGAIFPAYCASKGAVRMLTRSVALRCAEAGWNIRCNSIHPGAIETPIMDPYFKAGPSKEAVLAGFASVHPMKRVGQPHEVAAAAVFLASDESSFITGIELPVDGGYLA